MRDCCPTLKLTSALTRSTSNFSAPNSISCTGDKIFVVYEINVTDCNKIEAELFYNDCGKLMTFKMLYGDFNYPYVDGGQASPCFHKYSVLDDNGTNTARLRIFDKDFNILGSRLFKDYYAPGFSFNGGSFSENGDLVAITYVYDANIGKNFQKSVLRILCTDNLNEVACYKYEGNTSINVQFFTLEFHDIKKKYLILTSQEGRYDAEKQFPKPPSLLKILELKDSSIELVCETQLPEFFHYDFIKISKDSIYILVGTNRANVCNDIIIQNKSNKSFLGSDGDEYRVYKFKSNKLKLVQKKKYGISINPTFYPDSNYIVLQQTNSNLSTFQFVELNKFFCPIDCHSTVSQIIPNKSMINFSKNGEWLIITGAKNDKLQLDPDSLKNILLFKVHF